LSETKELKILEAVNRKTLELNDYEVLGVGALRKKQLLEQKDRFEVVLKNNGRRFLPGIYEYTLDWLKPDRVVESFDLNPAKELEKTFFRIFPQGSELLGDSARKLLEDYLQEMPWEEGLIDDHFRYFPFFVRTRLPQHTLWMEVFLWEWIQHSLTYMDFGDEEAELNVLRANPSLITLQIIEATAVLKKDRGLYAYVCSAVQNRVVERQLTVLEAAILDLLSEDRKFSKEQIVSVLNEEKAVESVKVLAALDLLIQSDIINIKEITRQGG
jgi:hypothetical protein